MTEFSALFSSPVIPMLGVLGVGMAAGWSWRRRGIVPGLRQAIACVAVGLPVAWLGFVLHGLPLVRPALFCGLLLGASLAGNLMAFAVATRKTNAKAAQAAILGVVIAALPALLFVLPAGLHRVLHWNPGFWLTLGWIRAHAADATLEATGLRFPASFEASYALAPIVLCAAVATWLARRNARNQADA
ncbi:MAG: hypothetical protein JRH01_04400 [Deltaproteobacteria bacterium]|nr:hypothetical protein [Deltaproteobacteria bacterium]MBW2394116.1 hypothetical protein [Deltaproteobacteria bacterium]